MARARNIKPGTFKNEDLADLDPLIRLFFIGSWTVADYKGCFRLRPRRLKVEIMPYDDLDIEQTVSLLSQAGFYRMYVVQGERYVKIVNFEKHQHPHKNEIAAGSEIPDEEQGGEVNAVNARDAGKTDFIGTETDFIGTNTSDSLNTDSLIPDSRTQNTPAFQISPELKLFTDAVIDGLKTEHRINQLPKESEWCAAAEFAFQNNFTADHFLETYRLMRQQEWRKGRITAANLMDNLPELERIRTEIAEQKRGKRPFDPGNVQPTIEIHCDTCGDVGTITRFKKGSHSLKDATRMPCPGCTKEAIAA